MMTLHQKVLRSREITITIEGRRAWRRQARATVARVTREHSDSDRDPVDLRGWREGRPIGSGRAVEWHALTYRHWSITCQELARTGFRGARVREIARALRGDTGPDDDGSRAARMARALPAEAPPWRPWGDDTGWLPRLFARPAIVEDPDLPLDCEGPRRIPVYPAPHVVAWRLWYHFVAERAIAEDDLADVLASEGPVSGYLASSILRYAGDERQTDYGGCSGCRWHWLVRERPELWPVLLARAPVGPSGVDDRGPWEAVYPHEIERRDALLARGWAECMGMEGSVWRPTVEALLGYR